MGNIIDDLDSAFKRFFVNVKASKPGSPLQEKGYQRPFCAAGET
jgi:hypothetical protein